jgi:hypothetical protein
VEGARLREKRTSWTFLELQIHFQLFACYNTESCCYFADDDNIRTIKKNTQTLTDASTEVGLEVNTEKTKYMLLSRHQNAGQNHDIKIGNRCSENVAQFRYLETATTNESLIKEETELR